MGSGCVGTWVSGVHGCEGSRRYVGFRSRSVTVWVLGRSVGVCG